MDTDHSRPAGKSRWNADDFGATLVGVVVFLGFGVANLFGWLSRKPAVDLAERIAGVVMCAIAVLLTVLYIRSVIRGERLFRDPVRRARPDDEPMIWD